MITRNIISENNNNNTNEDTTMNSSTNNNAINDNENETHAQSGDAVQIEQIEDAINDAIFEHCEACGIPEDARTALINAAIKNINDECNN